jgi:hypothetical protein
MTVIKMNVIAAGRFFTERKCNVVAVVVSTGDAMET